MLEAFVKARDLALTKQIQNASLKERLFALGNAWYFTRYDSMFGNTIDFLRNEGKKSRALLLDSDFHERINPLEFLAVGMHVRESNAPEFAGVRFIGNSTRDFLDPIVEYQMRLGYLTAGAKVLAAGLVDLRMIDPDTEAVDFGHLLETSGFTVRVDHVLDAYNQLLERA